MSKLESVPIVDESTYVAGTVSTSNRGERDTNLTWGKRSLSKVRTTERLRPSSRINTDALSNESARLSFAGYVFHVQVYQLFQKLVGTGRTLSPVERRKPLPVIVSKAPPSFVPECG